MRVRAAAGGSCLIFSWSYGSSPDNMVRGLAVGGRDPKTTDFFEYNFESNGSHFISRYPGEAFPDTGVGYGERTGTVHGKPYKGKITVDRKGRDHFVYTVVSEQGVDEEFTYRRVQEEQVVSPAYEHLKDLEDFIGDWVAERHIDPRHAGICQERGKGDVSCNRPLDTEQGHHEILTSQPRRPLASTNHERWIFGWDAVNKKIVYSGFDSLGGRVWGEIKKENPDKWIWESNWANADGTQGSLTGTMTMLDNNNTHVHNSRTAWSMASRSPMENSCISG